MIVARLVTGMVLLGILGCLLGAQDPAAPQTQAIANGAGVTFFENKVRPILVQNCFKCHGPDSGEGKAELRVDSLESLLQGGVSGPAIVRGEPEKSPLILAVRHDGNVSMPPKKKLAQAEIDALTAWVKMGAPWPTSANSLAPVRPSGNAKAWDEQARDSWAFQPLRVPTPPPVVDTTWPRSPIDRFILAKLEAAGLRPAPPAGQADAAAAGDARPGWHPALARRNRCTSCAMIPTRHFERVVDRLLASPRYGERWGRHWLDIVRYADSNGMDDNLAYSDAWRYRDYVIAAFNADKPYNRFVEEQIAGDLLAEAEPRRRDELLVATGFLAIGPKMLAEDDPVKQQMDIVDEQLDTTCRVFLALTMGCAALSRPQVRSAADERLLRPRGDLQEHADDDLVSRRFKVEHDRAGRLPSETPSGGARADHRPARQRARQREHEQDVGRGPRHAYPACWRRPRRNTQPFPRPCRSARGRWETSKSSCAAITCARTAVASAIPNDPGGCQPAAAELCAKRAAGTGTLDHRPAAPAHRSRDCEPRVALAFRPGRGAVGRQLRQARAAPLEPGASGLAGHSVHRRRMVLEVAPQANPAVTGLPDEHRMERPGCFARPGEPIALAHASSENGGRSAARLAVSNERPTRHDDGRNANGIHTLRESVGHRNGTQPKALSVIAAERLSPRATESPLYEFFQAFDFPDPAVPNGDRATTTVASQALFSMNGQIVERVSGRLAEVVLSDACRTERDRLQEACRRIFGRPAAPRRIVGVGVIPRALSIRGVVGG